MPSFIPGVPGRARRGSSSHVGVRVGHAVLGVAAGIVWLVLPLMTTGRAVPVSVDAGVPVASASAQEDETSGFDLILPVAVVGTAAALAGYGYVRRTRRSRTRRAPGGAPVAPSLVPELAERDDLAELDQRARALLVAADDWVRTSREELDFAEAGAGTAATEPFARAVREADAELTAAFRMRWRYEEGVPEDPTARRQALAGIVGRCEEAGRRLDSVAGDFDRLRGLDSDPGEALNIAETRFRGLTARTATAGGTLADLVERYGPATADPVTGYVEQAKDRLVFATTCLNAARQSADRGELDRTAGQLRAAEGAVAQADVFVSGVERLAAGLSRADALVPPALTGAEAELAAVRRAGPGAGTADVPAGELRARLLHADTVLAGVRDELTAGTGTRDPLDALRRIVRACAPLGGARTGILSTAALLTARSAVAGADDFVTTHRGAVNWGSRTRLAEARRLLASAMPPAAARSSAALSAAVPPSPPDELVAADTLAHEARDLAEQDVRTHGNPYAGTAAHASGLAGAVLGGILLMAAAPEDPADAPPACRFGGPGTRGRRVPGHS